MTDRPACRITLNLNYSRANYQCRVWHLCLEVSEEITNPSDHGWVDESEETLSTKWVDCESAPESVGRF